jgi:glycosyltransferase involved in cell wall biosynthesis
MKIAVNTRNLLNSKTANGSEFAYESFKIIAAQHPEHEFIFITGKPLDEKFSSGKNITSLVIEREIKNPLLAQVWYSYKLPALAKKYKADILVNTNGICSLRTKIPQCVIVQDLSFLHQPKFGPKKHLQFYKKLTLPSLVKAKNIITTSQFAKQNLISNYKINEEKIDVAYSGANEIFKPIDWKQKELIKEKYTEGKEFFLFVGFVDAINNLITLLKAFSFFKKRQKSNMQLLIVSTQSLENESFTKSLKTYKYRNEIKLVENLAEKELAKITAAAYAFICPALIENFYVLQAMKCGVPVIVLEIAVFFEIYADAALYANPDGFEDFADKMMLIYKDEKKREELIEKGKQRSQLFHWDKTAGLVWQAILKTVQL